MKIRTWKQSFYS